MSSLDGVASSTAQVSTALAQAQIPCPRSSEDLWGLALDKLSEEEKKAVDFERATQLTVLDNLLMIVRTSEEECASRQWRYKRKSGEKVILRDPFGKLARWIDRFRDIGDIAVQYDPIHAALP